MSNIVKIKRSLITPAPPALAEGELAYSENSQNLFIGTNAGADIQLIGGKTAMDKLATIAASANNYTHPTGDGNLHVPATSTTNNGKVLTAGATAGSASWLPIGGGTVLSVTAGDGMTQSGTSTVDPTLNIVSHAGSAGAIGTVYISPDSIGINLGATGTTACAGDDSRLSDARTPTAHTTGSHSDWPATVDMTEVGYLNGVTSGIQTQIGNKIETSYLDTDVTLAANSDVKIATQKAVKAYADNLIGAANAMVFKGVIDASTNPDYPAADAGDTYTFSVAGKIGGVSGQPVEASDLIVCNTDATVTGTDLAVGSFWNIIQKNIDGAVVGPVSATNNNIAVFDTTTGKIIKDGGSAIGDLQPLATVLTNTTASFTTLLASNIATNNAKVSNVTTNLSTTHNPTNVIVVSSDGTNATIDAATASLAGVVTNTTQTFGGTKSFADISGTDAGATLDSFIIDGGAF